MSIYVLTGMPGSGKTTALMSTMADRPDVGGFLSPVRDHKRWFYFIRTARWLPMESDGHLEFDGLKVGPYVFLKSAFAEAVSILESDFNSGVKSLVLDEFGPLEISGCGLMPGVERILKEVQDMDHQHLVVVIRSSLVDAFLDRFPLAKTGSISDLNVDFSDGFF